MEYLTEWPPKDDHSYMGSSEDNRTLDLPCPAAKRPRHGTGTSTEGKLSIEEIVLAESELSHSAAALLARWWKLKAQEPSALTLERQKLIPASSNPHTLLHHIARYGQGVAMYVSPVEAFVVSPTALAAKDQTNLCPLFLMWWDSSVAN